jgi:hypothetical protein
MTEVSTRRFAAGSSRGAEHVRVGFRFGRSSDWVGGGAGVQADA